MLLPNMFMYLVGRLSCPKDLFSKTMPTKICLRYQLLHTALYLL